MKRLNILWSYAYLKNEKSYSLIRALPEVSNILIDCGAFTAWMTGKEITIEKYIEVCKQRFHGKVWQYIALDKIRVPAETRTNLAKMLDAGLTPMPVYVEGMDLTEIPVMVKLNQHICVPGGTKSSNDFIHHRIQSAHKASEGKAKIHALGFLRFPDVFQLPLFSGDSSSYSASSRFGKFFRFSPRTGPSSHSFEKVTKSQEFLQYINRCNVPKDLLYSKMFNSGEKSFLVLNTVFIHIQYSRFCLERGFKYFWAISEIAWVNKIAAVLNAWQVDHFDYPLALETFDHLQKLTQNNDERYESLVIDLLRKY